MQLGCSSSLKLLFLILTGVLVLLSLVYKAFNSSKKKITIIQVISITLKDFFFFFLNIFNIFSL